MKPTRSTPAAVLTLTCASFVLMGLVVPAPARAQNELEGVLGMLGIMPSDNETKYPERVPLVVPPQNKLPKPKNLAAPEDPHWVKDYDAFAKKEKDDAPYVPGTMIADFMTKQLKDPTPTHNLTDPPSVVKKKAVITPEIEAATKAAMGEEKPWYKFW